MIPVDDGLDGIVEAWRQESAPARVSRLVKLDVGAMVDTPPPEVPWIVDGVAVRGCLTLVAGREGVGKSLLTMALAVGVLRGEDVGPFATKRGRVLVIDGENGATEIHRRLRALSVTLDVADRLAMYETEAADLLNDLTEIEAAIVDETPDLVVIDAFRTLWAGKENESDAAAPVINALRNLAARHECGIILLHHAGKMGGEYRGSTAIGAGCQVVLGLDRAADDEEPDRLALTCFKMRPAQRWPKRWIRLAIEMDLVCLEETAPPGGEEEAYLPTRPARDRLSPSIIAALDPELPRRLAAVCAAVGRPDKDGTVRRILAELVRRGQARRGPDGWTLVRGEHDWRSMLSPEDGGR
jgi:archaellum biogenesis ATPase FlaH